MGIVLRFPRRHARASAGSRRAANRAKCSAVMSASIIRGAFKTVDHQSAGIRSLYSHFLTEAGGAPISDAMASADRQSLTIERNEVGSDMEVVLGQPVPKIKSNLSHDYDSLLGQTVSMDDDDKADREWQIGFRERIKIARGEARTQDDIADLLGITQTTYSKYEGTRGTVMPIRHLPRFCKICGVTMEWLIEGDKKPVKNTSPKQGKRRTVA